MQKTQVTERRWLIIPIETKSRELHAKTLLAMHAAERGWGVVIGDKTATRLRQHLLPQGMFFDKDLTLKHLEGMQEMRSMGNRISAVCEEGLMYFDAKDYQRRKISLETFRLLDYFFTWGRKEAVDLADALGEGREKMVISGNPRFDLLRPEWRGMFSRGAREIREEYGKTILINTKFVSINHNKVGDKRNEMFKERGVFYSKEHEDRWERQAKLERETFEGFRMVLPVLSERFPEHTIVVRVHPSESDAPWIAAIEGLPNVCIRNDRNVNEWILASDVLIQNNCTTAVEAFLLGKMAVSYRPYVDERAEFVLPNGLSVHARTIDELVTVTQTLIDDPSSYTDSSRQAQYALAKEYIANVDGVSACETIMNTLDGVSLPSAAAKFPLVRGGLVVRFLRKIKRQIPFLNHFHHYSYKKFASLTHEEMEYILKDIKSVSGRFSDVVVTHVDGNGFCIYKP